jgi:hypothetical protein
MRPLRAIFLAFLVIAATAVSNAIPPGPALHDAATRQWQDDILALEALDRVESHPADSILFIGSSSIRIWDTIGRDMAPYHPIQRAYGGAKFSDLAVFARRLIAPHQFQALVVFVANDVTGTAEDSTPEQVAGWFGHIIEVTRAAQPNAAIFCIAVTPSPARWEAWPMIRESNRALARTCASHRDVHFIPTAHAYLDEHGLPQPDLFQEDRLHLNELGYRIWAAIILSHLDERLHRFAAALHNPVALEHPRPILDCAGRASASTAL